VEGSFGGVVGPGDLTVGGRGGIVANPTRGAALGITLGAAAVFSATSLVLSALPAEEEEVDDDNDDDRDDYVGHRALVQDRSPPVSSWNRRSIDGPGASSHDASYGEVWFQERPWASARGRSREAGDKRWGEQSQR
jgi:hypothetical protein